MSSSLIVQVCEIKQVNEHPNADALEIAIVKGWECIIKKGQYKVGDTVVYIPADAVLPAELADRLGVRNYLKGKDKDRVGSAKLRGSMSYGLLIDNEGNWEVGTDVADYYGITKYVPPVRAAAGDAAPRDPLFDRFTDIENIKNFPDVFHEGEMVVVSEKIDGTNCRVGITISVGEDDSVTVEEKAGSHGLKRQKPEDMSTNTYWYPWTLDSVKDLMQTLREVLEKECKDKELASSSITLYGEVYGRVRGGHKSMHYGKPNSLNFAAFGIKKDGKYLDWDRFETLCNIYHVPMVPVLGIIPYNWETISSLATGNSVLAAQNGAEHMREGAVVLPLDEREDPIMGRVTAKFLNPDYILLKQKKEEKGEVTDFTDE